MSFCNFAATVLAHRRGNFSTSVRQFCHFGASILPLQRVLLTCWQFLTFERSIWFVLQASRQYGFTTLPRQFLHVRAAVLPLRRVPLACRRSSFTNLRFQLLHLVRAQSVSAVRLFNIDATVLARRRGNFSTLACQFCHFGASVLPLRRVSFATSARPFSTLAVFCFGMSADIYSMLVARGVLACRRAL